MLAILKYACRTAFNVRRVAIMSQKREWVHTLTGNGSEITVNLSNPLDFNDGEYEVGLKSLYTSNSIPNVTKANNCLRVRYPPPHNDINVDINLEPGTYELIDIINRLNSRFKSIGRTPEETEQKRKQNQESSRFKQTATTTSTTSTSEDLSAVAELKRITRIGALAEQALSERKTKVSAFSKGDGTAPNFFLVVDKPTLRAKLSSIYTIDFTIVGSIGPILGFGNVQLPPNDTHYSTHTITITTVNVIHVECNIANGTVIDGIPSHSIYDFYPSVPVGYKIVEKPSPMIYYPISSHSVNTITIILRDQAGNKIDLRGEQLSVALHIRAVQPNR